MPPNLGLYFKLFYLLLHILVVPIKWIFFLATNVIKYHTFSLLILMLNHLNFS